MTVAEIREAAGLTAEQLPDDATPKQIADALRTTPEPEGKVGDEPPPETPPEENAPPETPPVAAKGKVPEGMVLVDEDTLTSLKAGAETAQQLAAKQREQERDRLLDAAMEEGRFGRARRQHYAKLYDVDPEGTTHLLTAKAEDGGLAPGSVPRQPVGADNETPDLAAAQGTGWFPSLNGQEA